MKKEIKDIKRLKQIIGIIAEEGFAFAINRTRLKKLIPLRSKFKQKLQTESDEIRLRRTLERLGPTFIKLGQLLSIRPDLMPKSYIAELEKLQEKAPSFPTEQAKRIIEQSLGKKINEIFKSFDDEPLASASIAQVHKGILKNGNVVAIKVKRPDIKEIMDRDIEIMLFIARLLDRHGFAEYKPIQIVNEFADWTKKELNFNFEAENIRRFHANFLGSKSTKIPRVYDEYCTDSVIVMEFMNGVTLRNAQRKDVSYRTLKNGFNSILEQVFIYGLFHGDPHPSNIMVMRDGRVGFVDFGIVGRFDDELKRKAIDLFVAISQGDPEATIDALLSIGQIDEDANLDNFKRRVRDALYLMSAGTIKQVKISNVLEDVLDTALEFKIKMPKEFVLFAKTIVTIEGVALIYYPDFKFSEAVQPFIAKAMKEKYSPKNTLKDAIKSIIGLKRIVDTVPRQAARILDKIDRGKIKIEMKDTDIEKLAIEVDKSSNRLAYGMIIAALLVSGSLVINVGEKVFYGLPILSVLCFAAAIVIGIMLIISIMRE